MKIESVLRTHLSKAGNRSECLQESDYVRIDGGPVLVCQTWGIEGKPTRQTDRPLLASELNPFEVVNQINPKTYEGSIPSGCNLVEYNNGEDPEVDGLVLYGFDEIGMFDGNRWAIVGMAMGAVTETGVAA